MMTDDLQQHRQTDQLLERLLGESLRSSEHTEGDGCPDVALWHELALGSLSETKSAELNALADNCALCAAERALAAAFVEETMDGADSLAETALQETEAGTVLRFGSRTRVLALVATMLFAVAGVLWLRSPSPELPPVQAPGSGEILRSAPNLVLETPIGTLSSIPREFRWQAHPEAITYTLRIERVDGELLIEHSTTATTATLSDAEVAQLREFVTYDWTVHARTADGNVLRSDRQSFVSRPAREAERAPEGVQRP